MKSGRDAKPDAAVSQSIRKPVKARLGREGAIAHAVNLSDLVIDQPSAMAFYNAAFSEHPNRFVTYDDLRKQGDLLDKDSLRELGLRANVKLSAQFLATLNERGRADPIGVASVIGLAISTSALHAARSGQYGSGWL